MAEGGPRIAQGGGEKSQVRCRKESWSSLDLPGYGQWRAVCMKNGDTWWPWIGSRLLSTSICPGLELRPLSSRPLASCPFPPPSCLHLCFHLRGIHRRQNRRGGLVEARPGLVRVHTNSECSVHNAQHCFCILAPSLPCTSASVLPLECQWCLTLTAQTF